MIELTIQLVGDETHINDGKAAMTHPQFYHWAEVPPAQALHLEPRHPPPVQGLNQFKTLELSKDGGVTEDTNSQTRENISESRDLAGQRKYSTNHYEYISNKKKRLPARPSANSFNKHRT